MRWARDVEIRFYKCQLHAEPGIAHSAATDAHARGPSFFEADHQDRLVGSDARLHPILHRLEPFVSSDPADHVLNRRERQRHSLVQLALQFATDQPLLRHSLVGPFQLDRLERDGRAFDNDILHRRLARRRLRRHPRRHHRRQPADLAIVLPDALRPVQVSAPGKIAVLLRLNQRAQFQRGEEMVADDLHSAQLVARALDDGEEKFLVAGAREMLTGEVHLRFEESVVLVLLDDLVHVGREHLDVHRLPGPGLQVALQGTVGEMLVADETDRDDVGKLMGRRFDGLPRRGLVRRTCGGLSDFLIGWGALDAESRDD